MVRPDGVRGPKIGGSNGSGRVQVIMCPWHRFDKPHPGGAPMCMPSGDLVLGNVLPLADLITWMALSQAEVMMVLNDLLFGAEGVTGALEGMIGELEKVETEGEEPEGAPA